VSPLQLVAFGHASLRGARRIASQPRQFVGSGSQRTHESQDQQGSTHGIPEAGGRLGGWTLKIIAGWRRSYFTGGPVSSLIVTS
jgi:hypothetical protein